MPTYAYRCEACGHRFEEFQSIMADALRKCPECGKPALQRLIGGGAGILFKGSGFYETDYRSGAYASDAKKDAANTDSGTKVDKDAGATPGKADPPGKTDQPGKADKPGKPGKTDKPAAKGDTSAPAKTKPSAG